MRKYLIRLSWFGFLGLAVPSALSKEKQNLITINDVERHNTKKDCWIIIQGMVYDISSYIDEHPAPPELLTEGCGKDVTEGWNSKGALHKPHSKKAEILLRKFFLGKLSPADKKSLH